MPEQNAKPKQHMVWITDRQKFYDYHAGGALLNRDTAAKRLARYDEKFESLSEAYAYLEEAMQFGLPWSSILADRQAARQSREIQWSTIYEAFREHVPIKFKNNLNGQCLAYVVQDNNEVTRIQFSDNDALKNALLDKKLATVWGNMREFYNNTELLQGHRNKITWPDFIMRMLKEIQYDERMVVDMEPVPLSWDEEELAYKKMDSRLLVPGPTPTWDEFCERLDYPDVFKAWIWSIFDPTNNLRQALWLRGSGADGKSSVQKAIEHLIGSPYCHSLKPEDLKNQWFYSCVFGKILVNYADCKDQFLIGKLPIKQLTGGDTTSIEAKGENAFTGKIYAKLFVTSNVLPKINPEFKAEASRLIKLEVLPIADTKRDSGFESRLKNEAYAFLWSCREAYTKYISAGKDMLVLPQALQEKMFAECGSDIFMNLADFMEKYMEFGEDLQCRPQDLTRALQKFVTLEKNLSTHSVKHYEEAANQKLELEGCYKDRLDMGRYKQTMIIGCALKPEAFE